MPSRSRQAFRAIFLQGNFHRLWQILLKSPLAPLLARIHGLWASQIKRARQRLSQQISLSSQQDQILQTLRTQGFARVDVLFQAQDFAPLSAYLENKLQDLSSAREQQRVHTKDFWVRLSDADFARGMTTDHPLVQLSLKKELLEIAARYLGQASFLEYILLTYSLPSAQPLKASQLWHQDHDNDRMLKFFIYLSDVEKDEDGPFTLLPKEARRQIRNSFFPRHLSDAEVQADYPLEQMIRIKGRRFSAFMVDTSQCYHMGSRVSEGHSRLMSTSLYVSLPKAYWGKPQNFVRPTRPLTPLEQAAVQADFDQVPV